MLDNLMNNQLKTLYVLLDFRRRYVEIIQQTFARHLDEKLCSPLFL